MEKDGPAGIEVELLKWNDLWWDGELWDARDWF